MPIRQHQFAQPFEQASARLDFRLVLLHDAQGVLPMAGSVLPGKSRAGIDCGLYRPVRIHQRTRQPIVSCHCGKVRLKLARMYLSDHLGDAVVKMLSSCDAQGVLDSLPHHRVRHAVLVAVLIDETLSQQLVESFEERAFIMPTRECQDCRLETVAKNRRGLEEPQAGSRQLGQAPVNQFPSSLMHDPLLVSEARVRQVPPFDKELTRQLFKEKRDATGDSEKRFGDLRRGRATHTL